MTPFVSDADFTLYVGDVRDCLRELEPESVHCALTSPPFYALRDYGVEGQIGLEETPELWVEALVSVFAEVRRVLRPDGTLWIECGDSYNAGTGAGRQGQSGQMASRSVVNARLGGNWVNPTGGLRIKDAGTKPKDLMGTPWMLATALRDPHYTGRIKNEVDRVWLAAMVDAEGCIHIHKRKAGSSAHSSFAKADGTVSEYVRKQDTYGVMVSVSNTSEAIVDRCGVLYGLGSKGASEAGTGKQQRKQTLYRWTVTGDQARDLLRELYPHLVAKQQEARIALDCPRSGDRAAACQEAIKLLHNGAATTVDGKPPASMFEPGWYLRQCIVWGKPNCMPESATDRCTTAHSYVFLLSKQPRYWFDAEAIAEPAEWARWGDQTVPKYEGTDTASGWMRPKGKNELIAAHAPGSAGRRQAGFNERWDASEANGTAPTSRNPRSVWTIPTQPFSARALGGGASRTVSPDCPVHGDRPAPAPTVPGGGREGQSFADTSRTDARPAQALLDGSSPTGSHRAQDFDLGSSDSPFLERAPLASSHSSGNRRTDPAPATSPPCTPSARSADRTGDTSASPESSAPHPGTSESRTSEASGERGPDSASAQRAPGTPGICTCKPSLSDHFATWPEALCERIIKAGCPEGGTVLDPFMGSGTTALVARRLGRRSIGIELNEEYARLAARRLQQQSLFATGDAA